MPDRNRYRSAYSQLQDVEKKAMQERRKILAAEKAGKKPQLFPVPLDQEDKMSTSTSIQIDRPAKITTSSALPSDIDGSLCMLYDVNIGVELDCFRPVHITQQRTIPAEPHLLPVANACLLCEAKRFPYEPPNFCCSKGDVSLYPTTMPHELKQLYSGSTPESIHFRKYIKPYNDIFAFTSMGVVVDEDYARQSNGIYTFRAQGQIYHYINSLYPSQGKPSYLQLYYYDTEHELINRQSTKNKLEIPIIERLIDILEPNPYSRFFRSLRNIENIDACDIRLNANPKIQTTQAAPPVVGQVGAIWNEDAEADDRREREIIVQTHDGHSQRIRYYYGLFDSLQYPLLFPQGEPGWHQGIKKRKRNTKSRPCIGQGKVLPAHSATAEELIATESAAA